MFQKGAEGMGQNLVGAVSGEDGGDRNPVGFGNGRFEEKGVGIGIEPESGRDLPGDRLQDPGRRGVGIFVGVELDVPAGLRLFSRHVGGQTPGGLAPESLPFVQGLRSSFRPAPTVCGQSFCPMAKASPQNRMVGKTISRGFDLCHK